MSEIEVFKKVEVVIQGRTPLLMNRLNPESLKAKTRMRTEEYSTEKDAANAAYMAVIDGKKRLYVPNQCIYSMMIGTAKQYKVKRTSLSSLLAGTMRIEPEKVSLGTDKYEIDERAVVIQNQRVLKGRALVPLPWKLTFYIVYDAKFLPAGIEATLKEVLQDAGVRMGLLDYRPQHKGWFGTFRVTGFKSVDVPVEEQIVIEESPIAQHVDASEEAEEPAPEPAAPQEPVKRGRGRPRKKK